MSKYDFQGQDVAFNDGDRVTLDPGQVAEVVINLGQVQSEVFARLVAIDNHPDTVYTVIIDGQEEYGPAPFPPTDPTDASDTFTPPRQFSDELVVRIENNSGSNTRQYDVQLAGWERPRFNTQGSF